MGRRIGRLAPGYRADLLILDPNAATLYGRRRDKLIDSFVFASDCTTVRDVMVAGRWVVRQRHHAAQQPVETAFRRTLDRIASAVDF